MSDYYNLSEEDIKRRFINPALEKAGWKDSDIKMEYIVSDGKVKFVGKDAVKEHSKRADYVLFYKGTIPIAVIEAKKSTKSLSDGIQQAMGYAEKLNVLFAYSSNGEGFLEHDYVSGSEREIKLDDFPRPEQLYKNYKLVNEITKAEQELLINQPYYNDINNNRQPRYYQIQAVNATLNAIGQGRKRLLLVLATGTGKTFIAFQIVYRLINSGLCKKILYLADRNILVDQSISQDFAPLKKVCHKIEVKKEDKAKVSSYQVYFALYQQLVGNGRDCDDDSESEDEEGSDEEHFSELFEPDFFDLIIVDECHRGSAKADSKWRRILEYFKPAYQLGMTATPKETKYASNTDYFGKPLYMYSLKKGIEDGYLAPFKVIRFKANIDEGWRPSPGIKSKNGEKVEDREYSQPDYGYKISMGDRIVYVAREVSNYLKATDRYAKTIVFCPSEDEASLMRTELINENKDIVKEHPDYVVRITGSDKEGKGKLSEFISIQAKFPVIATTSKLLSTGVDCKMTKVIVFDQNVLSMTDFKQMVGRGTRIRAEEGKLQFRILDFRNVTTLFSDPDWDGPVEIDPDYPPDKTKKKKKRPRKEGEHHIPVIAKGECDVRVVETVEQAYSDEEKVLVTENIVDYTKKNILDEYVSLENFIKAWRSEKKENIKAWFSKRHIDLAELKQQEQMTDVDDFDFICHLAFDRKPLTRRERADKVRKQDFFAKYSGVAKEIIEALLEKYQNDGIYDIESKEFLKVDPFRKYGKPAKIASYFGGMAELKQMFTNFEKAIYDDGVA